MNRTTKWLAVTGLGLIGMVTLVAGAGDQREERVTLDQVPPAVKATILKESTGGKITEIERETRNGQTVYEAEFLLNGREIEILLAADGTLLGRKVEIGDKDKDEDEDEDEDEDGDDLTIDQVPLPARAALLRLAARVKIVEVERKTEHGAVRYEAEWVVEGVEHEAAVTADGTLLETEESVAPEKAPAAVRAAIRKHFGPGAKVVIEKKMIVVYEVEAKTDGKEKELLIFPTGRVHEAEEEHHGHKDKGRHDDDDDDDDNGEDDD